MPMGRASDLQDAVQDLKEVLVQEPNSRAGLYFMAQANFNLGNIDQARAFAGDLERDYAVDLPAKLMQVQINLTHRDENGSHRLTAARIRRAHRTASDSQN